MASSSSRKLMMLQQQQAPAPARSSSLDESLLTVLAVILCALIVAVSVTILLRCALRVARWALVEPAPAPCVAAGACEAAAAAAARVRREAALEAAMSGLVMYWPDTSGGAECAICLGEFAAGERVQVLPGCEHRFHAPCVGRWLESQLSCPTCRRCLFDDAVSREDSAGST